VTDTPPSEQPAQEPVGEQPAVPEPPAAVVPPAAPEPPAAFVPPAAAEPPAAVVPPAAPEPPPPYQPPPAAEPPSFEDDSAGPGGLAAAFPPDRPERAVGAAFAGGMVLALILKRLAR
jgi:hypothetical protein